MATEIWEFSLKTCGKEVLVALGRSQVAEPEGVHM